MDDFLEKALKLAALREEAMKQSKGLHCHSCHTDQIQLINGYDVILSYKCRKCKSIFSKERNDHFIM